MKRESRDRNSNPRPVDRKSDALVDAAPSAGVGRYRPLSGEILDLFDGHSKQEEVICSHLFTHLDIGAI